MYSIHWERIRIWCKFYDNFVNQLVMIFIYILSCQIAYWTLKSPEPRIRGYLQNIHTYIVGARLFIRGSVIGYTSIPYLMIHSILRWQIWIDQLICIGYLSIYLPIIYHSRSASSGDVTVIYDITCKFKQSRF